jgi:hypothetical protein
LARERLGFVAALAGVEASQRFAADQRGSHNKRARSKRKEVCAGLRRDDNDTIWSWRRLKREKFFGNKADDADLSPPKRQ